MLCFVVDAADVAGFSEAVILLLEALRAPDLHGKPVLLLLNKKDMAPVGKAGCFREMLCWEQLLAEQQGLRQLQCKEAHAIRHAVHALNPRPRR